MFGMLELSAGRGGKSEVVDRYGMPVLRVRANPAGWLGGGRLRRAGRELRRGGVVRVLFPPEIVGDEIPERMGLRRIDPGPFLRAQAPRLAMAALERREMDPGQATIALSGPRTGGEMLRAAMELCPKVRRLVIAAPDGERLALRLREEFGVPVLPADYPAGLELCFDPHGRRGNGRRLELYGEHPELDGARLCASGLSEEEQGDLPFLTALWEWGKLDLRGLKLTETDLTSPK